MSDVNVQPAAQNTNQAVDPTTEKLPFKEKIAYFLGDVGSNTLLDIGTLYLLKFYTDVLELPAAYGGIIFLISKFFTAFTDIFTGITLDSRKNFGKRGKFRAFIFYFSFPVTLLAIANFIGTDFSVTGKALWATMLFMLFGLFFSLMNCSYGAVVVAMTKNPKERASLAAWRLAGSTFGLLISTVLFVPIMNLIGGTSQEQYVYTAIIFSLTGLICMHLCYRGITERYLDKEETPAPEPTPNEPKSKLNLLHSFKAIAGNGPLFALCMANIFTFTAFNMKLAVQVYYTQYVLNDTLILSYMGFFSMGCIFIGVSLMPKLVNMFGKKPVVLMGLVLWFVGDFLNYFFGGSTVSYVLFSCITYFGTSFANALWFAIIADCVEYGEWKTGVRSEGTVYTGYTFFRKIAQGLAGFIPGFMLTLIGYVPNVAQTEGTIEGIRWMIFIIPGLGALGAFFVILFGFKLTEKMFVQIVHELEERKKNKQESEATAKVETDAS